MPNKNKYDAIIIGGGIAGASVAYALSKRNQKTLLLERRENVAQEASGNPTGLVYPLLTKNKSVEGLFSIEAFHYAIDLIQTFKDVPKLESGFLIPKNASETERYLSAIKSYSLSTDTLEFKYDTFAKKEGFHFKTALAVSPVHLTKKLLSSDDQSIVVQPFEDFKWFQATNGVEVKVERLGGGKNKEPNKEETYLGNSLFLCHSNSFLNFVETNWLPIQKVRGQLALLPMKAELTAIPHSYLFGDYLTRDLGVGCVLGASFDEFHLSEEVRNSETLEFLETASQNVESIASHLIEFKSQLNRTQTRVSFRSQSQDRRPIFGKLPSIELFQKDNDLINKNRQNRKPIISFIDNVYVLGALGSRGLTHSLYAAEQIVRDSLGEPTTIDPIVWEGFKPERFLLRNWKRGQ